MVSAMFLAAAASSVARTLVVPVGPLILFFGAGKSEQLMMLEHGVITL